MRYPNCLSTSEKTRAHVDVTGTEDNMDMPFVGGNCSQVGPLTRTKLPPTQFHGHGVDSTRPL